MSFQDVGKRNNTSGGGNGHMQRRSTGPLTTLSSPGSPPSSGNSLLGQISESLLQYQRNVGILDKIVASRRQSIGSANQKELQMQYSIQVDVVDQLEEKVKRLLSTAQSNAPQIVKLKRDFERVQARTRTLKSDMDKMEKHSSSNVGNRSTGAYSGGGSAVAQSEHVAYQQMQLQLQEDRLTEEIMREREEEIRNINRGMHQVNEIYRDLAHIVGSQQEQIDTIETQMEDARANAESGLKQVEKANENYGNSQCVIS